jgi:hypothetical protein
MPAYIIYFRSVEGLILRHGNVTYRWSGPLDPFVHEELLTGWPEPKVLWGAKIGQSLGLAPIT